MHGLILALLFAVPPQAPPVVDCPPVAPPVAKPGSFQAWATAVVESLPDHQGEPVVAEKPASDPEIPDNCDCGDVCRCVDCQCPDCPHRAVKDSLTAGLADGFYLITADWCPACPAAKRVASSCGFPVTVIDYDRDTAIVSKLTEACPQEIALPCWVPVTYGTPRYYWFGQWGSDGIRSAATKYGIKATSQGATGYRVENPVSGDSEQGTDREGAIVDRPVSGRQDAAAPGWHSHQCPCGHRWSHDVNNLGDWWAAHTCDRCGRLVTVHAD